MTLHDIATELLLPLGTIYNWSSADVTFPKKYKFGTRIRVKRDDFDRWCEEHEVFG